jgi:hypothetical protein
MRRSFSALFTSLCLLAVWLSTPILAVAHVVVSEHRFCAEHERMEEGTEVHAPGVDEAGLERDDGTAVLADQTEESESGHEACTFVDNFTLEDAFIQPVDFAVEQALASEASPALHCKTVHSSLPLLRVAPKNSPPHIA